MTERHHGVTVIVTNPGHSRFFVQQKDEEYPRFPLGYSLFGGRVEPGEAPVEALTRELHEELGDNARLVLQGGSPRLVLTTELRPEDFVVSVFEAVVDDARLDALAQAPVYEGKRGAVFSREQLPALDFVWGLGQVIGAYLREHVDA